jgi:hypothetical protein
MPARPFRLAAAVALVSMAALAYQLLLMRWLAIAHWHPFAVVIISLALLGHGASGTALSLAGAAAVRRFDWLFPACAIAFALSAAACLWLARALPFNGLELVWNPRQLGWLAAMYLCLALPFLFAAGCFGLAFARHGAHIPLLYGADLLGAGLGAVLALALLWLLPVDAALAAAVALAPLAAALSATGVPARRLRAGAALALGAVLALVAGGALAPPVNAFKALPGALLVRDARIVAERHSPYGWLAVVESPRVPLRLAPGLSLANEQEPAPQLGLYVDGDAPAAITRDTGDPDALAYLGRTTAALPYRLLERPRVLVLGAGGGVDVLQALLLGARAVDAVERNPQTVALVREEFDAFAGGLYRDPRVRVHIADARAFVRRDRGRHDLLVLGGGASFAAGGSGVHAVAEDYTATREAFGDYLAQLAPGGMIAVTRWDRQPPREMLRLLATAIQALRAAGAEDPGAHLLAIRNWDAATLLVARAPFTPAARARAGASAEEMGFDLVHPVPGPAVTTRPFHGLADDPLRDGARALLSTAADRFLRDYKFDVAPVGDDRPYAGNFFRWSTLPELWALRGQGGAVLLESGYLLLVAALAQAVPLSIALVLLPLLALPRGPGARQFARWRAGLYFLCLGVAFMCIEIATLSRLQLLVGAPLPAIAVGLAAFLLFAGCGSAWAQRWESRGAPPRPFARAVGLVAIGLAWHLAVFALALDASAGWPVAWRAALGVLSIAPLAFAMGLPFPLGLARLSREAPAFVPWAWGLNGCASVVAAIGALLLAIELGLRATLLFALALYLLAALAWPNRALSRAPHGGRRNQ